MQVSIYLDSHLVQAIDRKAKLSQQSRSRLIQSLLELVLVHKKKKTVFDEVCGVLGPSRSRDLLHAITKHRRDSVRFG